MRGHVATVPSASSAGTGRIAGPSPSERSPQTHEPKHACCLTRPTLAAGGSAARFSKAGSNTASGDGAFVGGGDFGLALAATAAAANGNAASGTDSFVGAGGTAIEALVANARTYANVVSGVDTFVGGGDLNAGSGNGSFIGAGNLNNIAGNQGAIAAGCHQSAACGERAASSAERKARGPPRNARTICCARTKGCGARQRRGEARNSIDTS
jgi:hypothetical protein